MPVYVFSCACGNVEQRVRTIADRAARDQCSVCGGALERDFGRELPTITIAPVPLNFFTQWGDVYGDVSQKDMAKRADVERYQSGMSHKPAIPRPNLRKLLPAGVNDVDTLVKHLAPVDGQRETDKMLRAARPVEGETAYA